MAEAAFLSATKTAQVRSGSGTLALTVALPPRPAGKQGYGTISVAGTHGYFPAPFRRLLKMQQTIAITAVTIRDDENEVAETLKERGYALAIHSRQTSPDRDEQRALLADAAGLIAGSEPLTREVLSEAPNLRVISRNGVGFDAVDLEAATELGIVVTFVPDAMVDAVADLALGLLLSLARRIPELDAALKGGEWRRAIGADVAGRTLGLVGTGRIGMAVARRAKAFRMRLLGYDPHPNPLFQEELGGDYVSLEELLELSDFVSLHVPATRETRGLIGTDALARMKSSAFLVNTARGSLVDEQALLEALQEGRIAGAALDVFSREPPEPGSPAAALQRLPNVVATPHVAAYTPITAARMGRAALANLLAVLDGVRPPHVANPEVYDRALRS
jgi:D-3-phosphoglycerate dehydrogenase